MTVALSSMTVRNAAPAEVFGGTPAGSGHEQSTLEYKIIFVNPQNN